MKKILSAVLALALALGFSMPVYAATPTTMPVSMTVVPAVAVSATSLDFGSVTPATYTNFATATITVNATNGLPYAVTLNAGLNFSISRKVKSTSLNTVGYDLYKDASYLTEWGDLGYGNTYTAGTGVAGTGSGAAQTLTVYGYAGISSTAAVDTYSDTVTVTVNY